MSLKYSLRLLTPVALSLLFASSSVAFAQSLGTPGMGRKEEIHMVLYKIYKQQGKLDLMGKEEAAIVALNPDNSGIQMDYARALFDTKRFKESIPHWLKVTKSLPSSGESWAYLGDCYMQLGNYTGALSVYSKAVANQKPGQDYRARYQQAQQYIEHQRQEKQYREQQKKQKEDSDD